MTRTLSMMVVAVWIGAAAGAEAPSLRGHEAPSATDLLRAERLAEQAEKRLRPPKKRGAGWRRGGAGWEAAGGATPASPPVIINMRPPKRAPRGE